MKSAELCAGYSGLHLGMLLAGWPVELSWVSEVNPDAVKVLAARHPEVPNIGDLTTVAWSAALRVDILSGGIPCQPWSGAGPQLGSLDERDLWPIQKLDEQGRPRRGSLDAIRELGPRVFVLENVASLITAERGVPFGIILADLAELGYSVAWMVAGACDVDACHHRHRLVLIAILAEAVAPEGVLFGAPVTAVRKWPTAGLIVGERLWSLPVGGCSRWGESLLPTPTARDATRGAGWGDQSGRPLSEVVAHYRDFTGTKFERAIRRHAAAFGLSVPDVTEPGRLGEPRATAAFVEFMMGHSSGFLADHVDREAAIRMAGNGAMARQIAYGLTALTPYLPAFVPVKVAA